MDEIFIPCDDKFLPLSSFEDDQFIDVEHVRFLCEFIRVQRRCNIRLTAAISNFLESLPND